MSGPIVPFSCIPGSIQEITGAWTTSVGGVVVNPATNASLIAAVSVCDAVINRANPNFPVAAQTIGLLVRPSDRVNFNGSIGDRLMNLPVGFVLNEINVDYTKWFQTTSPFYNITLQQGPVFAPYIYSPVMNTAAAGSSIICGNALNKRIRTSVDTEGSFNYLSALYDPYGFTVANYGENSIGPNFLGLSGTYFQWSLTITVDTDIGVPGDIITLTDPAGKFDQLIELAAYYQEYTTILGQQVLTLADPLPVTILVHTNTVIKFVIPDVPINHIVVISGLGNGVEFSGYAPLQVLNANLVDGSGIYSLYPDWRNDTYYDRGSPGDLVPLKIPKPFGKTGYFNAK